MVNLEKLEIICVTYILFIAKFVEKPQICPLFHREPFPRPSTFIWNNKNVKLLFDINEHK
jgi:hypothetical protein